MTSGETGRGSRGQTALCRLGESQDRFGVGEIDETLFIMYASPPNPGVVLRLGAVARFPARVSMALHEGSTALLLADGRTCYANGGGWYAEGYIEPIARH